VDGAASPVFVHTQTLFDTLTETDLAGDTSRYSIAVSDPSGGTDSLSFTVIAYNRPPSLIVTDTVYLFSDKTGRALTDHDTISFMKRHKVVFRADFQRQQ